MRDPAPIVATIGPRAYALSQTIDVPVPRDAAPAPKARPRARSFGHGPLMAASLLACLACRGERAPRALRAETPAQRRAVAGRPEVAPPVRARRFPARMASGGALALAPDESLVAVADSDHDQMVLLSLAASDRGRMRAIRTEAGPEQVVIDGCGRAFVAARGGGSVAAYDLDDGRLLARAPLPDPTALALSPDERWLFVTSTDRASLCALDAATLRVHACAKTPRAPAGVAVPPDGRRVLVAHLTGAVLSAYDFEAGGLRAHPLPALALPPFEVPCCEDGMRQIAQVPSQARAVVLSADGARALVPFMANRTGADERPEFESGGYGAVDAQVTSFQLAALDLARETWEVTPLDERNHGRSSGERALAVPHRIARIPAAAARAPDGSLLVASLATDAVVTLPAEPRGLPRVEATLDAPVGLAVTARGEVLVYSQVDHGVESRLGAARERWRTGAELDDPALALGRRLFVRGDDGRLSSGGLACAHCHPDGRDDGLRWRFNGMALQTPTLAGRLLPPFGWRGLHADLASNLRDTFTRLGARTRLPDGEVAALARYLERGLPPPSRATPADPALAARGAAVFTQSGCAGCHDPSRGYADGQSHTLTRGAFDTPSLVMAGASAPYFHDGRYATLREMLTDRGGAMLPGREWAAGELDALIAFLETL